VLMYLESFGNPRKFSRIARRVSREKPIVLVKSGRTSAGVRAASSHTAAIASTESAVEALFQQTGVIRTETLEELFDVATLLSSRRLPTGRNVAILTNAGGPGILAADALESNGLEVPALSDRTQAELTEFLPLEAGTSNPVDMIASASPESYGRALRILGAADEIDAVFVIFIPAGGIDTQGVARALIDAKRDLPEDLPVVGVFMSAEGLPRELAAAGIASFTFPEAAARAMGRVATYATWRRRPLGELVVPDGLDREGARETVDRIVAELPDDEDDVWADAADAASVLRAYGVPLARSVRVSSPEEAAEAQRDLGGPVAVKLAAPIHKADIGGIRLDVRSPEAAAGAVDELRRTLTDRGLERYTDDFLVQEMLGDGVEMVVGVTHDPSFGPIILTGMGGTLVELLRDVSVRITPVTDVDVEQMVDALRMAPLLRGYRGEPPADVPALRDLLHRVNAMVEDLPEVAELDLNPVFVRERGQGVAAVDVRMRLSRHG
jgi:acyl-CoA synthetase (NDP forming)